MELLETIARNKADEDEVAVHLVTVEDSFKGERQRDSLEKMQSESATVGINLTWEFDTSGSLHARHIITDHGWKISLDRGLDIFQHYEMNEAFSFSNRLQQYRGCKAFEVTFIRTEN
jgi:ATP-dependent Lon protease